MHIRLWPRTLAFQLIAVTAAAVVVSNLAVAFYFERTNLAQFNSFVSDRWVDRTTAVATTVREVPVQTRDAVMRTMSTRDCGGGAARRAAGYGRPVPGIFDGAEKRIFIR